MTVRRIQLRRDTSANWSTINPALRQGEIGVDLTSKRLKVGDGFTSWNSLDYVEEGGLEQLRTEYGTEQTFNLYFDLNKN